MERSNINTIINDKRNIREKTVNTRTNQIVYEAEKKKNNDEKIEIMTQFMLDPTSSATKLLEKRREMYELQEALQRDKEKFSEKELQFKKTEEELRNRDEEFHKKIIDYFKNIYEKREFENNNITTNEEKDSKYSRKLAADIKKYDTEKINLYQELLKLREINSSLKRYDDFLNGIKIEYNESYSKVSSIIEKYNTLRDQLSELEKEGNETKNKMDELNNNFRKDKANKENFVNELIKNINHTQKDLKNKKDTKKILEQNVIIQEQTNNDVDSALEQILLGIDSIYTTCNNTKSWINNELNTNIYDINKLEDRVERAKGQYDKIKEYLKGFIGITEEWNKKSSST